MKRRVLLILSPFMRRAAFLAFALLLLAAAASAATVRGRLDRVLPNGAKIPATGVAVTIYNQAIGRSSPTYADRDGMYSLFNLRAGSYYLEVWTSPDPRVRPTVYPITVVEPYTDIPPIVVP